MSNVVTLNILMSDLALETFVQDGAPAHAAEATQAWYKKNLPNL